MKLSRNLLREGELTVVVRFACVGVAATLLYLLVSLLCQRAGIDPRLANLVGFMAALVASYLGHYTFTYRSGGLHRKVGARFVATTLSLVLASSLLLEVLLRLGVKPASATVAVALFYPAASFLANHFWSFSRTWGR